jgi:hypothetical protein
VDLELLALVDDRFARGYFRDWMTFTHTLVREEHDETGDCHRSQPKQDSS